jgi:hypothetical protein
MQQNLTYPGGPRGRGLAVGLAVSLLLHLVLLAFLRAPSAPPPERDERRWTQPLSVRLLPPPAVPRVEPPPPPPPERRPERKAERRTTPAEAAPRREREERPTMTAVPAQPAAPATPAEPAPSPFDAPPKFDPDAAKATARALANDLDTPSSNWAAEKLNQGKGLKETKEERLGRNVANSARPDCRTAYAGAGLFAPLLMLMDKKDSGCKF